MPGEISRSYKGPNDGSVPSWMDEPAPPTLQKPEQSLTEFELLIRSLDAWRNADHQDRCSLSRDQVIVLLDGIKRLLR